MKTIFFSSLILYLLPFSFLFAKANPTPKVSVGIDVLLNSKSFSIIEGKRIGLITNQTAVNAKMESSITAIKNKASLTALFAPEHGLYGSEHAEEIFDSSRSPSGIPIYSLYGKTRRPSKEMLKNIDVLIYDIQDIGSRSYTYISTLFYAMEEAANNQIPVIVLDRPNPIGGLIVDGTMLEQEWRSYVGYINVPYCHGMTTGELARFFNEEYNIGCKLTIIPMKGWKRSMIFHDTGLPWIPTSPHIPEEDTPFYYPTTGILGELQIVNIGVGYTLPFKLIGAPWINADDFSHHLNAQNFPGVHFQPFHYKPFYGSFKGKLCHGVRIIVTNANIYKPVSTQFLIIGILKSLYPKKFKDALNSLQHRKQMFCQILGTEKIYRIMKGKRYITWALQEVHKEKRQTFLDIRKRYLMPEYSEGEK